MTWNITIYWKRNYGSFLEIILGRIFRIKNLVKSSVRAYNKTRIENELAIYFKTIGPLAG